jgi:hypothetical protein
VRKCGCRLQVSASVEGHEQAGGNAGAGTLWVIVNTPQACGSQRAVHGLLDGYMKRSAWALSDCGCRDMRRLVGTQAQECLGAGRLEDVSISDVVHWAALRCGCAAAWLKTSARLGWELCDVDTGQRFRRRWGSLRLNACSPIRVCLSWQVLQEVSACNTTGERGLCTDLFGGGQQLGDEKNEGAR